MNRKYLNWLFIVAIILAGAFFIAGDLFKKTANEPLVMDEPKNDELGKASVVEIKDKNDITLKPQSGGSAPPALGRSLNVTTSISGLEKDEAIEQIKHFEASLINKPENLHEWVQLGSLRKVIGDYLGAEMYWKYASILEPTYHVPYNNLANLYHYYLNDIPKAEEYYKKYLEVSPTTEDPYKLLFELYMGSIKEKENLAIGILEDGIKNVTHNEDLKKILENYKASKQISE